MNKDLGSKPSDVLALIRLLNSKSREESEKLDIEDRTYTILEVRKVLTKNNLMLQLDNK